MSEPETTTQDSKSGENKDALNEEVSMDSLKNVTDSAHADKKESKVEQEAALNVETDRSAADKKNRRSEKISEQLIKLQNVLQSNIAPLQVEKKEAVLFRLIQNTHFTDVLYQLVKVMNEGTCEEVVKAVSSLPSKQKTKKLPQRSPSVTQRKPVCSRKTRAYSEYAGEIAAVERKVNTKSDKTGLKEIASSLISSSGESDTNDKNLKHLPQRKGPNTREQKSNKGLRNLMDSDGESDTNCRGQKRVKSPDYRNQNRDVLPDERRKSRYPAYAKQSSDSDDDLLAQLKDAVKTEKPAFHSPEASKKQPKILAETAYRSRNEYKGSYDQTGRYSQRRNYSYDKKPQKYRGHRMESYEADEGFSNKSNRSILKNSSMREDPKKLNEKQVKKKLEQFFSSSEESETEFDRKSNGSNYRDSKSKPRRLMSDSESLGKDLYRALRL